MNRLIFLIAISIIINSCKSNKHLHNELCNFDVKKLSYPTISSRIMFDSICETELNSKAKEFKKVILVYYKKYKFEIRSVCIRDSISSEEANLFYPPVINQEVFIYKENKLISNLNIPKTQIEQKLIDNSSVLQAENVIMTFGIIKINKTDFIVIQGYGGCDSCPEYFGMYTLESSPVFITYRSKYKKIIYFKDEKLFKSFKIKDGFINKKYSNISIW